MAKKDPPGSRRVGGKLMVPFTGKKPAKRSPTGRAGGYAAPVDTTGMDPEMMETLKIKRRKR